MKRNGNFNCTLLVIHVYSIELQISLLVYLQARIVPWLPGVLFGGLSIGVGMLVFLLPETHNKPLPQTIEDIENWSKPTPKESTKGKHEMLEMGNDTKEAINA